MDLPNKGLIETVNPCEWLVTGQLAVAETVFDRQGLKKLTPPLRARFTQTQPATAPKKLECIGRFLAECFPSKYVQDSVANWLNDASKSNSTRISETCPRWQKESPSSGTERTVRRSNRTLRKG